MEQCCDSEMVMEDIECGYSKERYCGDDLKGASGVSGECEYLPDDVVSILADCACEYVTDELAFSLLSSQHREVMVRKLRSFAGYDYGYHRESSRLNTVEWAGGGGCSSIFEMENLVDYFSTWSHIGLGGSASFLTSLATSLSFYCKNCHRLIITQDEVDSPHYHGGYGPAFLANLVFNCHQSEDEAYETQFTTGVYRVCDVTCLGCNSRVGKKYIEARDPANFFKVGKILLEQTLLTVPKCCNNRKQLNDQFPPGHYFCHRESSGESGTSCFCSVCLDVVKRTTARAILSMTKNCLDKELTLRLLSLLTGEKLILSGGGGRVMEQKVRNNISTGCSKSSSSSVAKKVVGSVLARLVGGHGNADVLPEDDHSSVGIYFNEILNSNPSRLGGSNPIEGNFAIGADVLLKDVAADSSRHRASSPCSVKDSRLLSSNGDCSPRNNSSLSTEQISLLSRSVGTRLAMLPETQNWIHSLQFISELIEATNKNANMLLIRSLVIESLVANISTTITYTSASLLMSRLQGTDDRIAALKGLKQYLDRNRLEASSSSHKIVTLDELDGLGKMASLEPCDHRRWFGGRGALNSSVTNEVNLSNSSSDSIPGNRINLNHRIDRPWTPYE